MIPDFETFYNQLVENDIWFDNMQVQHSRKIKTVREVAEIVYGEYVGNPKMFPSSEAARSHVHHKLSKLPFKVEKPKEFKLNDEDFNQNPLTEDQKKVVDRLLSEYLEQLRDIKMVNTLTKEQVNDEGQWRPKDPYHPRGYKYYTVGDVQIMATSQEHAEELVNRFYK